MPQITAVRRLSTEAVSFHFDDGIILYVSPRPPAFGDFTLPLQIRVIRHGDRLGEINFGFSGQISDWHRPGKWSQEQTLAYYRQARDLVFSEDTNHGVCADYDLPHFKFVMWPYDPAA